MFIVVAQVVTQVCYIRLSRRFVTQVCYAGLLRRFVTQVCYVSSFHRFVTQVCYTGLLRRFEQLLDPVMLEVKKLRTLQRKGGEMDKTKVLEKTRKYLVRGNTSARLCGISCDEHSHVTHVQTTHCYKLTTKGLDHTHKHLGRGKTAKLSVVSLEKSLTKHMFR